MSTQQISLDSIIVQSEGNIVSDMDGEMVMMSINNGKYYNLGIVGSDIWDLTKSPIKVIEVVSKLKEVYEVEEHECIQNVLSFLENLLKENIIQIKERVTL